MSAKRVIAGAVGVTVLTAAALRGVLRRFAVHEDSMTPSLEPGDWIIARRRSGAPDRGDIVVFADPAGSGFDLVKRVIGLPGEQVGVTSGRVTIDSALLADRWANGATAPDGTWVVPDDHVWLLGDNRGASASDGRVLGPIPISDIQWVAIARYWPSARAGML